MMKKIKRKRRKEVTHNLDNSIMKMHLMLMLDASLYRGSCLIFMCLKTLQALDTIKEGEFKKFVKEDTEHISKVLNMPEDDVKIYVENLIDASWLIRKTEDKEKQLWFNLPIVDDDEFDDRFIYPMLFWQGEIEKDIRTMKMN